ncbi:MAG: shikimate dehydrogenase [Anaerolineae bacterium]
MDDFASLIHPLNTKEDVARRYPILARALPTPLIRLVARVWPPLVLSHVTGLRSPGTGREIEGWLVACPLTAQQMLRLPPQVVYDKVVKAGRLAQRQGARIVGVGGFSAIVGDGGVTVAQRLTMPVTTGNSLTVASAIAALEQAVKGGHCRGRAMGPSDADLAMERATAAVVGASGSIGLGCAEMLAPLVERLILVGRREIHLSRARAHVEAAGASGRVRVSTRLEDVREADLVLSATSATEPLIHPHHLKENAIVCDMALPSDVSPAVRRERKDVVLIDGGIVEVPGLVTFGFDFGLPAGQAYACMAEVMVLALEGRYESFSLGQSVETEKVREIARLARKHGFRLAAKPTTLRPGT